MSYDNFSEINREYRRQELISPPLWFEGYSIYRTAWCKKWVLLPVRRAHKTLSLKFVLG